MPSTYAHYRYGEMVLREFPEFPGLPAEALSEYREIFDIGCQGPDPFFYYHPAKKDAAKAIGAKVHWESCQEFLAHIPAMTGEEPKPVREQRLAYLAGFLCHFTLDSACHPYIEALIHHYHIPHSWVEGEFERYLLALDGHDPLKCPVIDERFVPSRRNAKAMAWFYPEASEEQTYKALKDMVQLHHVLYAPLAVKRGFIDLVLRIAGQYGEVGGHVMRPKPIEELLAGDAELERRMQEAVPLAGKLVTAGFAQYLEGAAPEPYFDRNFEHGKHWKDIVIP